MIPKLVMKVVFCDILFLQVCLWMVKWFTSIMMTSFWLNKPSARAQWELWQKKRAGLGSLQLGVTKVMGLAQHFPQMPMVTDYGLKIVFFGRRKKCDRFERELLCKTRCGFCFLFLTVCYSPSLLVWVPEAVCKILGSHQMAFHSWPRSINSRT